MYLASMSGLIPMSSSSHLVPFQTDMGIRPHRDGKEGDLLLTRTYPIVGVQPAVRGAAAFIDGRAGLLDAQVTAGTRGS